MDKIRMIYLNGTTKILKVYTGKELEDAIAKLTQMINNGTLKDYELIYHGSPFEE